MMPLHREASDWLGHRFGQNVRFNEPMSKHTYFKIGGPVDAYVVPQRRQDLIELIVWAGQTQQPYIVIGDGTNLLVKDGGIRGLVIVLTKCLNGLKQLDSSEDITTICAMAGTRLHNLCRFAIESGFKGMNFAIGIPGTVGGGIRMNAGTAEGSMEDVLASVEVLMPDGQNLTLGRDRLVFGYRDLVFKKAGSNLDSATAIILEGHFQLRPSDTRSLKKEAEQMWHKRKMTQPIRCASAGCFFKNPGCSKTAGELIELAGLKGKRIGGAEVSVKHANFIINRDNATAADVIALMQFVQETVSRKFNIELKPEVKIVGTQV